MMIVFVVEHVRSFCTLSSRVMISILYPMLLSPTITSGNPAQENESHKHSFNKKIVGKCMWVLCVCTQTLD